MSEDRDMTEPVREMSSRRRAIIAASIAAAIVVVGVTGTVLTMKLQGDQTTPTSAGAASTSKPTSSPSSTRKPTSTPTPTPGATTKPGTPGTPGTPDGETPDPEVVPPVVEPPVVEPPAEPAYADADARAAVESTYGAVPAYGACGEANYGTWSRYSTPIPPVYVGILGYSAGALSDGSGGWVQFYSCE